MTTIKAIVTGGRLELSVPASWPDGTEVEIHPIGSESSVENGVMSPEEIATTLAAMDRVEPFEMTDAEQAAIDAERRARKDWEKARFSQHADELRGLWE